MLNIYKIRISKETIFDSLISLYIFYNRNIIKKRYQLTNPITKNKYIQQHLQMKVMFICYQMAALT